MVGGAVRDKLLGRPVNDHDWVVVGATPEQMVALGYLPVGRDFPVFLHPETREEYALARTERKSGHGYRGFEVQSAPDVTLQEDLSRRDLTINAIAASAYEISAGGLKGLDYLRKIHQAEPATRIRLPASVERSSMTCFPKWSWQAVSSGARHHCAPQQRGAMRCIAPPHRGRSFRSIRIGWRRPARTESHRSSCQRVHGGQSPGQKSGGKHRRS